MYLRPPIWSVKVSLVRARFFHYPRDLASACVGRPWQGLHGLPPASPSEPKRVPLDPRVRATCVSSPVGCQGQLR
jgi:hypothetical protein